MWYWNMYYTSGPWGYRGSAAQWQRACSATIKPVPGSHQFPNLLLRVSGPASPVPTKPVSCVCPASGPFPLRPSACLSGLQTVLYSGSTSLSCLWAALLRCPAHWLSSPQVLCLRSALISATISKPPQAVHYPGLQAPAWPSRSAAVLVNQGLNG